MQIKMKHPKEGEKLVYLDDIQKHKAEGWIDVADVEIVEDTDEQPKKRGRPFKVAQ